MYNRQEMEVYFDNAATTMVCVEATGAIFRVMREEYGNPSSLHYKGRRAAGELDAARNAVATALGARSNEIFFTSGGTEADNWAILGAAEAFARNGKHIITSAIEHDAVMTPIKSLERAGWEVTYLMPDSAGRITADAFAGALREDTAFASIMFVNNETGAINPIDEFSSEIRRRKLETVLHTDAIQGFCKIPFTVKTLGVALLTVSAHKIHGPKGVGALYIRAGTKLPPRMLGGGQEDGKRSGTEALPAIAGFGEAARTSRIRFEETAADIRKLRDYIMRRIAGEIPEAVFIGDGDSPYILNLSLPGQKGEVLMSYLEGEGICVSRSAACKRGARSHVLEAMRLRNDIIDGALRVSFSRYNSLDEADFFVQTLKKASQMLIKRT